MTDVDRTRREWRWWHKFSQPAFLSKFCKGALFGHSLYFFCKGHSLWSCVTATDVERPGGADYVLSVPLSMEIVTQNLWHSRSVWFRVEFRFRLMNWMCKWGLHVRDPALRTRHTRLARADMSRNADLRRRNFVFGWWKNVQKEMWQKDVQKRLTCTRSRITYTSYTPRARRHVP
jgi:hypothetical protein